ncbi:unannotated protein [freshwater metagenome]|uniref:Unannotated protein n=1 Tax=freshwater metagenome TaxID=449393 RepID=A0A6J7HE26_9ZZZZ
MKYSVAVPIGHRGAGLGNEVRALAKARIGARVLGAQLVEQPWWLNPRHYGEDLGYNIVAPVRANLSRAWTPTVTVGRAEFSGWDYEQTMRELAPKLPDRFVLRHASGMAGGLLAIASERAFIAERLGVVQQKTLPGSRDTTIGVHVRCGDFASGEVQPGKFNLRLGMDWTEAAAIAVAKGCSGPIRFLVFSDASGEDLDPLKRMVSSLSTFGTAELSGGRVLDDLRELAGCDWIIPSVSSFSMLAIYLSTARYVWPEVHLVEHGTFGSIWGYEAVVKDGPVADAISEAHGGVSPAWFRGVPFDPRVSDAVSQWVQEVSQNLSEQASAESWTDAGDLILCGVAPRWSPSGVLMTHEG